MRNNSRGPLGYLPPKYANKQIATQATAAIETLIETIGSACEKSEGEGGSALLRIMVFEATLFVDAAQLAIEGHKRGNNRPAFVLQRCLFEYVNRAAAYRRGIVDAETAWKAIVHRVAEDERQAGGGARKPAVESDYQRWKEQEKTVRPTEPSFEVILKAIFDMGSDEDQKLVYQRYRRPGIFAHGALGAVDDMFLPGLDGDRLADRSLSIDPDAQLIVIAYLAYEFSCSFNEQCSLELGETLASLHDSIHSSGLRHNARRNNA
jgi:hypothetical protein